MVSDPGSAGNGNDAGRRSEYAATYDYRDEHGTLLYQVVRIEPGPEGEKKTFRQRRSTGPGTWAWGLAETRRVLYRLPELARADPGQLVFVAEGEKDVENLRQIGCVATTNAMGAGKWRSEYSESLRGRHVVILPDNDEPGLQHALQVGQALRDVAASVTLLHLPGLPEKGDVSDWLQQPGHDKATLLGLVQELGRPAPTGEDFPLAQRGDAWEPGRSGHGRERDADKPKPILRMRCVDDLLARPASWLWQWWIPHGTLTVLDGDPGLGKSTLTLDLAARVSRGAPMPPDNDLAATGEPASVILLSAEDDPECTVRPRLEAAGANLRRIHILEAVSHGDEDRLPVLAIDLELLTDKIRTYGVKLVVIDPFTAFLPDDVDAHKDQSVRKLMYQLAVWSRKHAVSLLVVRHLNKLNGGPALYRGGGSIGIVGAARSALVVGKDPEDEAVRVLAVNKSNLGPIPAAVAYKLDPVMQGIARIQWLGESKLVPADILWHDQGGRRNGRPEAERQEAESFLMELLAEGPVLVSEIQRKARLAGVKSRTLDRAKTELGVVSRKQAGAWYWVHEGDLDKC